MVRGSGHSKEYENDLDYWGAPDEMRPKKPDSLEIYPENWEVVQLFLRLQTQWRISPTGHRIGLEYQSIPPVCQAYGIEYTGELMCDLQLMELTVINESAK